MPASFEQTCQAWFVALAEQIALHQNGASEPLVLGINGAQGSGKSTLAALLVFILKNHFKLNPIALSVDDFYLTRAARQTLSEQVHPLLLTRGVPGTHDVPLAVETIMRLKAHQLPVSIPRFNKAIDDREQTFGQVTDPVDVIILEGWCMGAQAQAESALAEPANTLELTEDPDTVWREYVNKQLLNVYPAFFKLVDCWVMLKAPCFDCVFNWRLEQEDKLRAQVGDAEHVMSAAQVARFIQHYQRITENTFKTLPNHVHYLYRLNEQREIIDMQSKPLIQKPKQWLVFTDMDGSLLDHYTYQFDDALPCLAQLAQAQVPVIPITSKTQAELEQLRTALDNQHPFIIENGAAVFIPNNYFDQQPQDTVAQGDYWVKSFVSSRADWQALIEKVSAHYQGDFITFAQAGVAGIAEMTGLAMDAAGLAAQRQFGEPVSWLGSDEKKQQFIADLKSLGANVLVGGRFMHVSGASDKGVALNWLAQVYQQQAPAHQVTTIALGDSGNDVAMLETADYAVLIKSPVHEPPVVKRDKHLFVSTHTGPKGWVEGVQNWMGTSLQDYQ